jgi:hypothetical protein
MTDNIIIIPLDRINNDRRTQLRVAFDPDQIDNLKAAYEAGTDVPPIDVFEVGDGTYIIGDGFHRFVAQVARRAKTIPAVVHVGGFHDALKWALGANATHGLRRTNKDKRHAVEVACAEFPKLSNRAIADLCKVHHSLVSDVRKVADSATCDKTSRIGRDGKKYPASGQMEFFERVGETWEPFVKSFKKAISATCWLDMSVSQKDKLEAIQAMRKQLADMRDELNAREKAIKQSLGEAAEEQPNSLNSEFLSGGRA